MTRPNVFSPACLALLCALSIAGVARAEWPPQPKNLQVLPADIDGGQLIGIMRGFAGALGVRCQYCHVGEEGQPLAEFDFASDEKSHKLKAREMLRMTRAINEQWIPKLEEVDSDSDSDSDSDTHDAGETHGAIRVRCETCHRGQEHPELIDDLMAGLVASDGAAAAAARYRELRDEYYGGHSFDFGPGPLNEVAETVARAGNFDDALVLIELNLEFHADEAWTNFLHGEILRRLGDRERALAAYRKTLALEPDHRGARQRIDELTQPVDDSGDGGDGGDL